MMKLALTFAVSGMLACANPGGQTRELGRASASSQADTTGVGSQFTRFLTAALETTPARPDLFKDLQACLPDAPATASLWVGDFRIEPFEKHGDTLVARAQVTSVAEQKEDSATTPRFVVYARVKSEMLHWPMVLDSVSRTWKVCGFSEEGYDLGGYGLSTNTRFVPDNETRQSLLARVDSLRKAVR
jgi:hypothetical protein